jgi:hypothetical protein
MAAVGAAQAHGEVALQPHLRGLAVLGEPSRERLGDGDDRVLREERARGAGRRVAERLLVPARVPAGEHVHLAPVRRGLAHEREPRAERLGDVADEAAQELLADGAGGPLGDRGEQRAAAEAARGGVRRWPVGSPRPGS